VGLSAFRFPRYTSSLIPPSWKFYPFYPLKSRKDDDQICLDLEAAFLTPSGIREILSYPISQLNSQFWRIYDAEKTLNESYVNPGNEVLIRAIGKVKPGDVVYRRDGQHTIILRWAYLSLFLVAIGSEPEQISRWSLQPSRLTDDDFLDRLYIDYSYLRGCCLLFGEGLRLQQYLECFTVQGYVGSV
jgi:hypothetical protein